MSSFIVFSVAVPHISKTDYWNHKSHNRSSEKNKKPRIGPTVPKASVPKHLTPDNSIALLAEKLKDQSKDIWKEIEGNQ